MNIEERIKTCYLNKSLIFSGNEKIHLGVRPPAGFK